MMHPLPRVGRTRRYYQTRSVVRWVFWGSVYVVWIWAMLEFGTRK